MKNDIPIIDLTSCDPGNPDSAEYQYAVRLIHQAVSTWGFFLVVNTTVNLDIQSSLVNVSQAFFDLPEENKMALDVRNGGPAWRGYMPLGGEHTHGHLDWKEGFYVGPEHSDNHPLSGLPLHGQNQFPDLEIPEMRRIVLDYVGQVTELGSSLTDMLSLALGFGFKDLRDRFIEPEPVVLFRCFKYPPAEAKDVLDFNDASFGIGEHTGQFLP